VVSVAGALAPLVRCSLLCSPVRRDGKKEIEASQINELRVVLGVFLDFLPFCL
jgi:hypothetical protein